MSSIPVPVSSRPSSFRPSNGQNLLSRPSTTQLQSTRPSAVRPSTIRPSSSRPNSARKSVFLSAKKNHQLPYGQTPQTQKRKSVHPSSVTSSAGRSSNIGLRTTGEDRPITDPSYQKNVIEKLNNFLVEIGENHVSPKFASSPSNMEIRRVFGILFTQIGCPLESIIPQGKQWDSDIGNVVRQIGYPYPVAKRNLAINSTTNNARGQLFGLIEWMVDTASYFLRTSSKTEPNPNEEQSLDRLLFTYVVLEPDQKEEYFNELVERFFPSDEYYNEIESEKQQVERDIHEIRGKIKSFKEHVVTHQSYINDTNNFHDYNKKLEERIVNFRETAEPEKKDLQEQIDQCLQETEGILDEKQKIKSLIESQAFGKEDLNYAHERMETLNSDIRQCQQETDNLRKQLRQLKITHEKDSNIGYKLRSDVYASIESLKTSLSSPLYSRISHPFPQLFQTKEFEFLSSVLVLTEFNDESIDELYKALNSFIEKLSILIESQKSFVKELVADELAKVKKSTVEVDRVESMVQEAVSRNEKVVLEVQTIQKTSQEDGERINQEYEDNLVQVKEMNEKINTTNTELISLKKEAEEVERSFAKFMEETSKAFKEAREAKIEEYNSFVDTCTKENENLKNISEIMRNEVARRTKKNDKLHKALRIAKERKEEKEKKKSFN